MDEIEFRMGGRAMRLTRRQVMDSVRHTDPEPIQTWAVEIEGRLYPVKQVLAAATGESRASFISHRARDLMRRLGFRVIDVEASANTASSGGNSPSEGSDMSRSAIGIRIEALSLAVRAHSGRSDATPSEVIKTAEAFESWVMR